MMLLLMHLLLANDVVWQAPPCISYKGYERTKEGAFALRFFNGCSEKTMVYVCYDDPPGKFLLKNSPQSVPAGGSWKLYIWSGVLPDRVAFGTSPELSPCNKKSN